MCNKFNKSIICIFFGFLMILTTVFGGFGNISTVHADLIDGIGYCCVGIGIGSTDVQITTVEVTYLNASGSEIGNFTVNAGVSDAEWRQLVVAIPDDTVSARVKLISYGKDITLDSYAEIDGVSQSLNKNAIMGNTGQTFNITPDHFLHFYFILQNPVYSGTSDGGAYVRQEFETIFEDSSAFSYLSIGGSEAGSSNVKISTSVTKQGDKFYAATAIMIPAGFREAFSFNILEDGKTVFDAKSGTLRIKIPSFFRKTGRTFAVAVVDKDGNPYLLQDLDTSDDYITVNVNFVGYAFEVVFKD